MTLKEHFHGLRKYYNLFVAIFIFCMMTTFSFLATRDMKDSSAASLAGFNPGNIISDATMGNYNSMSVNDIQNFLTSKNRCTNTDYGMYQRLKSAYPHLNWHWENGHFVCLSEERFGDGETIGSGQTAAEVIYQAAQDYRINPQVLLVLLQKEQSLITDDYPNNRQYRSATGFGCPDTAACSAEYYGFKNQVRQAAKMFRTVLDGGWSNYPAGKTSYIQYNPNRNCGGSNVYIENRATSALYRYTPYQPNAAAINAGYGTGDTCGAYGNRNFYLYFVDWFGDIHATSGAYEIEAYYYKNNGETILGKPLAPVNCNIGRDGACVRAYEKGAIIYSRQTGAHESYGDIRSRHTQLGTVDGIMGYPVSGMNCNIGRAGACVQAFENGVIISSKESGTWESYGAVRREHVASGTVDGALGYPTGAVKCDQNNCTQEFEHGMAVGNSSRGSILVGEIANRYRTLGTYKSVLGFPIATQNCNIGRAGACVQAFENGVIISSKESGTWESYGAVRREHVASGTVDGKYGYPTSGVSSNGNYQTQSFEHGTIQLRQ